MKNDDYIYTPEELALLKQLAIKKADSLLPPAAEAVDYTTNTISDTTAIHKATSESPLYHS